MVPVQRKISVFIMPIDVYTGRVQVRVQFYAHHLDLRNILAPT